MKPGFGTGVPSSAKAGHLQQEIPSLQGLQGCGTGGPPLLP